MSDGIVKLPYFEIEDIFIPKINKDMIHAKAYWSKETTKGEGMRVAIISSGCRVSHGDLMGKIESIFNFTSDDNGSPGIVTDNTGVGTHIAGIIASNEYSDFPGVAPNSRISILKAIGQNGDNIDSVIEAIEYAIRLQVDIIVTTFSTEINDPRLEGVVLDAVKADIPIVAAIGDVFVDNIDTAKQTYPAAYEDVICVGCSGENNTPSGFNNINNKVDLLAFGENVITLGHLDDYMSSTGSIVSAAYVTGAYILVKKYLEVNEGGKPSSEKVYSNLMRKLIELDIEYRYQGAGILDFLEDK